MLVPGLSAAMIARDKRHHGADRRAAEDRPSAREPEPAAPAAAGEAEPYDAAYYASRFKSEIWRLGAFAEEPPPPPDHDGDNRLFNFFGHLSVLLLAVRDGDIERARAAADALEMEVLAQRSAGRTSNDRAASPWGGDFAGLLSATDGHGERADALDPASADAPVGSVAYDTLTHYLADDAPTV